MTTPRQAELRDALKRAASALKRDGPRFALAGSYALWAYGAPEPVNDVDLVVSEGEVEQAEASLRAAGFAIERTPEDWLLKARAETATVDVLHRLNGERVGPDLLERAVELEVLAIHMPVMPPTEMIIVKLRSLSEHHCDFAALLPAVRAVREQLDWKRIQRDTADNDFATAFLGLATRLGIAP